MSNKHGVDSNILSDSCEFIENQLKAAFPELSEVDHPEWQEILGRASFAELPARRVLMTEGSSCNTFFLLFEGRVRVYQIAEDGREVTLYRTYPGQVCLMTVNSLMHNRPFRANAETETDIKGLVLSAEDFHEAMRVYEPFRKLVLVSLMDSACDMSDMFYDTAFQGLDVRLACLLGRLFERSGSDTLKITHQELAQELGTSREVVSRLLKKMEHQQHIRLSRGQITVGQNKLLMDQA